MYFKIANSTYLNITCRVPQGVHIRTGTFCIYINDLSNIFTLLFTILFSDNTNIFLQGKNIDHLVKR